MICFVPGSSEPPSRDTKMEFSFLHAADLHLGSPLLGLTAKHPGVAERFAAASRNAFTDLVTQAIERNVAFVLIAGDVYDREWKDNSIGLFFNREVALLDRERIPVFLVKGNHDAASVVTKTIGLPASVAQFPTAKAETIRLPELGVAIHGRSFPDREVTENYALTYPAPVPGFFNVGVLHTSCDGRPGHAAYAPCSVADLASRGYDYWALGHVHAFEVLSENPWIVFPGNLQGRSVRECGPKGAVMVDVKGGAVANVSHISLDRARWAEITVPLDGVDREPAALQAIEERIQELVAAAGDRMIALRVRLTGASGLDRAIRSDPRRFADEVQAAAHHCGEEVWLEQLKVDTADAGGNGDDHPAVSTLDLAAMLDGLEHDPTLRAKAAELIATVAAKLPGGMEMDETPLSANLDALLSEARALLLGRAGPPARC